jgi:hypothetical protein
MYAHTQYEVTVGKALDISATGDKGDWAPGLIPHYLRGVAVQITNDVGATGTINIDKRITFGTDTGRIDNIALPISLTTAHTGGKIVYRMNLNVLVRPGEQLVFSADDAAAAGDLCNIIIYVEPSWAVPAESPLMVATA